MQIRTARPTSKPSPRLPLPSGVGPVRGQCVFTAQAVSNLGIFLWVLLEILLLERPPRRAPKCRAAFRGARPGAPGEGPWRRVPAAPPAASLSRLRELSVLPVIFMEVVQEAAAFPFPLTRSAGAPRPRVTGQCALLKFPSTSHVLSAFPGLGPSPLRNPP